MAEKLYEKNGNILYILNVLKKYSDYAHMLQTKDIVDKIKEVYDVDIDPRTVRRNIKLLKEKFDYDITTYNENKKGYYILKDPDTEFELGELEAMIEMFTYSNFVTDDIAKSIVNKCLSMMTLYEQEKYKDYKAAVKDTKTNNKEIINNIEIIMEAISLGKKITFDYYKYKLDENNKFSEEKVIPKFPYKVSPYKISFELQKLYLFGLKDGYENLLSYRLDRMKNIKILKEKINNKYTLQYVEYYIKNNVAMYTGNQEKVEIECSMELLDVVIETFGKDIKIKKVDNNTFYASFYTVLSGFKYWCLRNIENVDIISPQKLKKEINKILKEKLK
jgi:predicted DNA-binding transcriptional regulator YafY